MSKERAPRVIPPPEPLAALGPLVVVDGDCAYFGEDVPTTTAFSLPGHLTGEEYETAMNLGMRRSGTVVYRPLCNGCRKCQPLRVVVEDFVPSKSQRRVEKKNADRFVIEYGRPRLDEERLALYSRYQQGQHGEHAQSADAKSYRRFLIQTVTDTVEVTWRDSNGALVGVGILDVTPNALSSVYFYWDPDYARLSLGTYSALYELDLCRRWGKDYYYLGYLVPGSKTMSYKADFAGAEVWHGDSWVPLPGRGLQAEGVDSALVRAQHDAERFDADNFTLTGARPLPVHQDGYDEGLDEFVIEHEIEEDAPLPASTVDTPIE